MPERTVSSEHAFIGHVIRVRVDQVERSDGRRTTRDVVEHPGAVAIVAWDGARVAMVRQWRHATGQSLLEIPAGTLEPDEPPEATARRELAEETGLAAATWEPGPRFYTAPGFCDELMHLFLATRLSPFDGDAGHDEDEELSLEWLELADALAAVEDGRIMDAKTIAGVGWLARRLPSSAPRDDPRA